MSNSPLRDFVVAVTHLADQHHNEPEMLAAVRPELAKLVARDDWLPDELAQPHPQFYRQYLLHADPLERFSVVSFVWGPGQATPIHNHTVWGLIGMLRGQERSQPYVQDRAKFETPMGMLIDYLSGARYEYPAQVTLTLNPVLAALKLDAHP